MDPMLPPLRNRIRRRLASIKDWFGKLFSIFAPQPEEVRSQRMCPFCGLITPRNKRFCLECGKPLRGIQAERKDARQG
jgi:predicted amidophosphoribosyltransferase